MQWLTVAMLSRPPTRDDQLIDICLFDFTHHETS